MLYQLWLEDMMWMTLCFYNAVLTDIFMHQKAVPYPVRMRWELDW